MQQIGSAWNQLSMFVVLKKGAEAGAIITELLKRTNKVSGQHPEDI